MPKATHHHRLFRGPITIFDGFYGSAKTAGIATGEDLGPLTVGIHASSNSQASAEEQAEVQLIFDEESAVERRVSEALNKLFFGAEGVYKSASKLNAQALMRRLLDAQPRSELDEAIQRALTPYLEMRIEQQYKATIERLVDRVLAERLGLLDKISGRMSAAPKGPRK